MPSALVNFDVERFLREDWQRAPHFIEKGLDISNPIAAEELAGLALEVPIESRIVKKGAQGWQSQDGPMREQDFQHLPTSHWTLLVNAVDLWLPKVRKTYDYFDFLPSWRFDDIMVSYATKGGGVGPHFDLYDVFLVQVEGRRRWQIGQTCDESTKLNTDGGLRIMQDFQAQAEFITEPGDVLYLPPCIAHSGEALTPSITYSVGLRSPSMAEMLADLSIELEALGDLRHYRDPTEFNKSADIDISDTTIDEIQSILSEVIADRALITDWFARYMTRPRYPDWLDETNERRIARTGRATYINGERS